MKLQLGPIEWERPSEPQTFQDIEQLLNMAGKDILRIAWDALSPIECKHYKDVKGGECRDSCSGKKRGIPSKSFCTNQLAREELAGWFASFFNLHRKQGNGNACVNHLIDIGLMRQQECVAEFRGAFYSKPPDYYKPYVSKRFD